MKHRSTINRSNPMERQAGFIQAALLFGIALMTAILGGFALANRTPAAQTDKEEARVNAAVILKQASDLRDGVQRFATDNGNTAVLSMTFDNNAISGLFNPGARYASPQIAPNSAFDNESPYSTVVSPGTTSANGHWRLMLDAELIDIGNADTDDVAVILPDLTINTCQQINDLLYGTGFTDPTSSQPIASWAGSVDGTTAPVGIDSDSTAGQLTGADGLSEACVFVSGGDYVYFKIVQEN